jgi:isoquinoline 1-oxidoreductase beta subunit
MSTNEKFTPNEYLPEYLQQLERERHEAAVSLSRRNFIKITGLAGGGLVLAMSFGPAAKKALAQTAGASTFNANPYVQIKTDGSIVLFAKNPEVGQGVKTSLPMIVCEELDADWNKVMVQQSVIDQALYGAQVAGGSTSTPTNWDTLRRAGATARAMLVSAAAKTWNVPEAQITTASGVAYHRASNRQASYGELAATAATLPVPDAASVQLKQRSDYKLLGTRVSGVDNPKIVTGQPLFGIDQKLPGMFYASYTKAPAIGARAVSANLDEIKKMPGVKDAFIVGHQGDPINFGPNAAATLSGVAILANSTWNAFQAKKKLQVKWDESEAATDSWTAHVAEAKKLAANPAAAQPLGQPGGDVEAAFKSGKTVEGMYTYHYVSHADLEPQNCTAWFKGDSIEIWAPTQTPQAAVDAVAKLLDLPKEKVTLHQLRGGGGFGRRLANDSVCEVAAVSKQAGGVPVKVQWMREDDMAFDYYRPGGFHSFKAAVDPSGKLAAFQDHFITFTRDGKTTVSAGNLAPTEFPAPLVANNRMLQSMIASKIPTGPWRAPGSNTIAFAIQSFLHECAVAAGRDYRDFLLDVMGEPRMAIAGNPRSLNTGRAADVIKLVTEKAGWGKPMEKGRGLGLAFHFSHAGHFAEVADVSVEGKKIKVHKIWVAADIGPIVNMSGAENQCQGSVVDGLSTAMGLKITFDKGRAEQSNFDKYPIVRIDKAPEVEVHFLQSNNPPTGCGEPAFPPAAPAIANAIFAASGQRIRTLPFSAEGYTI